MKKRIDNQVDGFVRREIGRPIGHLHDADNRNTISKEETSKELHSGSDDTRQTFNGFEQRSIKRIDIDQSLQKIEESERNSGLGISKSSKKLKFLKPKKIIRWLIVAIVALIISTAGYLGFKLLHAGGNVFVGNFFDIFKLEPLKQDANGRSNFLIFGTAEDDEGGNHGGKWLTDSIMILSVDQTTKNAYMVSLPRDLWVKYDSPCDVGYQGKINSVYYCESNDGKDDKSGSEAMMNKAKEVTGIEIQYYIHLNFTAVVQAVDAVGGVRVVIESDDPRGIFDDNFDWKCNFKCNMVKYPNGLTPVLDGQHALALARARGASGNTYGLPNANFDREKNQQKILKAIREKALSAGTLSNIGKITALIDALGNNLKTNIGNKYIRTIMSLASDIKSDDIKSVSLVEAGEYQVKTGLMGDASAVLPVKGLFDYSGIHQYLSRKITSDPVLIENASIEILNGSGVVGKASKLSDELSAQYYNIIKIDSAPSKIEQSYQIYQVNALKSKTAEKLSQKFGVQIISGKPSYTIEDKADIVIIVGPETTSNSTNN